MTRNFLALVILVFGAAGFACAQQSSDQASPSTASAKKGSTPPYHSAPPTKPLPATIDPKEFGGVTQNIYALAAEVKDVLYQEPCYCGCDKEAGHKSLLDCYMDRHGSFCDVCKKEAGYTYIHTKKGETAEQIRKGIIEGKWKDVDLTQYEKPSSRK